MTIIKEFKNRLGITQLVKYEDENVYAVKVKAEPALYSSFQTYKYKEDAIATYQFNVYWLKENEKNV